MTKHTFICFLALLCSILPHTVRAQCSAEGNSTCEAFYNRTCFRDDICGACLVNYTDFLNNTESCFAVEDIDWEAFVQLFDPTFKADDYTPEERLAILIRIARFVSEHNAANNSDYELGINRYSADAPEDAKARTGYVYTPGTDDDLAQQGQDANGDGVPDKVDWVERGAVTSVKDQGRCGGCWAVAVCGAMEGAAAIDSDFSYLQSMSFQQFISCDKENYGCNGGNIVVAMVYALQTVNGLASLNDYPFTDEDGDTTEECLRKNISVTPEDGVIVVTFTDGRSYEERAARMKYALSRQPIAMVIKSQCDLFSSYKSGVLTDDGGCRCEDVSCVDHAILLVGYDDTHDPPYWKMKNSWSDGWGEGGYFRIAQGSYGREWGLFGMLGQGVVPLDVANVTGQVEDKPQTVDDSLTGWQIALIAIAAFLAALVCCCAVMMCMKK